MKIAVFDPNNWKFTQGILDHWAEQGHEIKYTIYADEKLIEWSDVTYFETVDNNMIYWTNTVPEYKPAKFAFCRGVDIDLWMRNPGGVKWEMVKTMILPFRHTKEIIDGYMQLPESLEIRYVPFGVDTKKFPFGKHDGSNHNILWSGDTWLGKNPEKSLEVLHELVKKDPNGDWKLTIHGNQDINRNPQFGWYLKYMENMVDQLGYRDRVTFNESYVADMNELYEQFDYVLVTSFKEMFSYVAAEAMCKGIKPIIGHFWGADKIWADEFLYWTPSEAADIILKPYDSDHYRDYIETTYPLEKMLTAYDEIINGN